MTGTTDHRPRMTLRDELQLARDSCLEWQNECRRLMAENADLRDAIVELKRTAGGKKCSVRPPQTSR
jgi:hypothetical protein